VLRGIARFAGVHIYSEAGDIISASRQLLAVHTVSGGKRTFSLPRRVEMVYDLFENRIIAKNTARFEVDIPPASTSFFYTGEAGMISGLRK
jgi:hypothetical protein